MRFLFIFSAGVLSLAWWPALPDKSLLIFTGVVGCFCVLTPRLRALAWLLFGLVFAGFSGYHLVDKQLPSAYSKSDFRLSGYVIGLPKEMEGRTQFYFQVNDFNLPPEPPYFSSKPLLQLSWYYPTQQIETGQILDLQVRLKRPRGMVNPAGFDYQAWLLRQGVSATGYVRQFYSSNGFASNVLDQFRYRLSQSVQQLDVSPQAKALLLALTVGDKQLIDASLWQSLAGAGVVHLVVISGLHIGFASFIGWMLFSGLARVVSLLGINLFARTWGLWGALLVAGFYATLAGWSIPTQRASIMVAVLVLAKLVARNISKHYVFAAALAGVAVFDPLAALDGGFWLSFCAVALLLFMLPVDVSTLDKPNQTLTMHSKVLFGVWQLFKLQIMVCIGISAILFIQGRPVSIVAPLVNLWAIPWLSFSIVPLCLMGVVGFVLYQPLGELFWQLAAWQLELFIQLIGQISGLEAASLSINIGSSPLIISSILIATFLLLLPVVRGMKTLAFVVLLAVFFAQPKKPPLTLTVLDVGQGLAIAIETPKYSLVYDAGPLYSPQFNAGEGIVAPYLHQQGIGFIDALLVSHDDNDHSGGVKGLLATIQPSKIIADKTVSIDGNFAAKRQGCEHRQQWHWDEVHFLLINPLGLKDELLSNTQIKGDNNQSCILLLNYMGQQVLLTGDIERDVEVLLLEALPELSSITVLIAPHHGSKTSSRESFVKTLSPDWVVFSAGYKHHFGHPHREVIRRYKAQQTQVVNTALDGAISFTWNKQGLLEVQARRDSHKRFWFAKNSGGLW